jgi:hypothetical protein
MRAAALVRARVRVRGARSMVWPPPPQGDFAMETMYNKIGSGDANASALEFDEWCELICRICDAKTGGARAEAAASSADDSSTSGSPATATANVSIEPVNAARPTGDGAEAPGASIPNPEAADEPLPFHKMLDTWLSLVLIPALRNAATDRLPPAPEDVAARARLRMGAGGRATAGATKAGNRIRVVLLAHEGSGEEPEGVGDHNGNASTGDDEHTFHVMDGELYHWGGHQG